MKHDQIALRTAETQLMAAWGKAVSSQPDLQAFVQSLAAHETALVQLELPTGRLINQEPQDARILPPGESAAIEGRFLGPAPTTDPQVQGEGFLFVATNSSTELTPGLALTGLLQLPGDPVRGVVVPDAAVVRWAGGAWIYAQTGQTNFARREVLLQQPVSGGWFVTNGVGPNEFVVVRGAQVLLSEERKTEIKPAD